MNEIIPTKLLMKMINARQLANIHKALIKEIDSAIEELGFDVDKIRDDDACGYVDMIDLGEGNLDLKEMKEYKK